MALRDWFVSIAGEEYATAVMWTLGALLLLIVILIVLRIIRGFSHGSFAIGGRNRLPRLAVTESAVVDNNRRLILVRRDDVEHLVLIGGPSDVVVEHGIRMGAQSERPTASPHRATTDAAKMEAAARPAPRPQPAGTEPPAPGGAKLANEQRPPSAAPTVAPVAAATRETRTRADGDSDPLAGNVPDRVPDAGRVQPEANTAPAAEPPHTHEAPATEPSRMPASAESRAPESSPGASPTSTVAAPVRPQPEASVRGNGDSPLADARIGPAPEIEAPAPGRNRNSLESEMSKLLDNLSERERQ